MIKNSNYNEKIVFHILHLLFDTVYTRNIYSLD